MTTCISLLLGQASQTSVGKTLLRGNEFEPEILNLLCYLCSRYDTNLFLDVGSNIGFFPLALRAFANEHKIDVAIHAHEPLPFLYDTALKLQARNDLFYTLHPTAISDQRGTADFYISAISDSSNSLVQGFRKHKSIITVKVNSIDSAYLTLCKQNCFKNHILMIDVETAEHLVLKGATSLLRQFRPHVICEVLAGRNEQAISSIMSSLGYHFYRFDGQNWLRESSIFGDKGHQYRDWWFIPFECAEYTASTISVPSICKVQVMT